MKIDAFNPKGTAAFFKEVYKNMDKIKEVVDSAEKRKNKAINEWFYGKAKAQKPLGKEFEKVLHDNLWDLYENGENKTTS